MVDKLLFEAQGASPQTRTGVEVAVTPELSPVTLLRHIVGYCGAEAPLAPLCKGSWHGEAVTEGLCSRMLRICIGLGGKGIPFHIGL